MRFTVVILDRSETVDHGSRCPNQPQREGTEGR